MKFSRRVGATIGILTAALILTPGDKALASCVGDCDSSGEVTVDEVLTMVNVGLGSAQSGSCRAGDRNGDSMITVDEIVAAVDAALAGCVQGPTATPTRPISVTPGPAVFLESWENGRTGTYHPDEFFRGDTGDWIVLATISDDPNDPNDFSCGEPRNTVEIVSQGGRKKLRVRSVDSDSSCSDNVWIAPVRQNPPASRDLNVGLNNDLWISFEETGVINGTGECDAVLLEIGFDGDVDILTYVLQRRAGWESPDGCRGPLFHFNALTIEPVAPGLYIRDIVADARAAGIPAHSRVSTISVQVDEHGEATFDEIKLFRLRNEPTPTPTRTPQVSCIEIREGKWCFDIDGVGDLDGNLQQDQCTVSLDGADGTLVGNHYRLFADTAQGTLEIDGNFQGSPATTFDGTVEVDGIRFGMTGQRGGC